uniref:Mediator of RNA polymerase II transcription subunit 28 n=1 Tax=Ananas comosus var. bracteatus TaxID=296719 RepID=A0A6V7PGS6_ANACO|nr:unnamed protein product [Ananas comosus var. bracteatus]
MPKTLFWPQSSSYPDAAHISSLSTPDSSTNFELALAPPSTPTTNGGATGGGTAAIAVADAVAATPTTPPPPPTPPPQQQQQREEMMACVAALEAALLPCLPARELQAVDRSAHSSHQIDVERHAREFMEAAKKLQLYFIGLQREDQPTREEKLRKEISNMEEELKTKSELIMKHEKIIQGWRKDLKEQLDRHITELERV